MKPLDIIDEPRTELVSYLDAAGRETERLVLVCTVCGRLDFGMTPEMYRTCGGECSTCKRPNAADYHARIDKYQERASAGLPIFDGSERNRFLDED